MNLRCLKSFLYSFTGLEEFEDKVDRIASGQDDDSWIGQIYNTFSSNFGMDGSKVDDSELGPKEGLEPPILDETWGLEDVRKLHETDEGMILILKFIKIATNLDDKMTLLLVLVIKKLNYTYLNFDIIWDR